MQPQSSQILLGFEQAIVDARLADENSRFQAKLAAKAQRAIAKRQAELDRMSRRILRDHERKSRSPHEHAQCGIRWYCRSPRDVARGCYWTHCHACGQALIYTTDPNAAAQVCTGRNSD